MTAVLAPADALELAAAIAGGKGFAVEGLGTRRGYGRPVDGLPLLSLKAFSGIAAYEPEELILEAGAATPLSEIEELLASRQQMLAFEPPDYSRLWGGAGKGSIGGLLATGLSGPRRIKAGSARDHVLGVTGVTGRAEIFKAGARVVKNVTGYDMPKLMAGSFGTLAALTSVTFKVLPRPETEETLRIASPDDASAVLLMSEALQSTAEISAAAHVPGEGTYLRFEGIPVSVTARRERFVSGLKLECERLDEAASKAAWSRIRDASVLQHDETKALWRISVPPMEAAGVAARITSQAKGRHFFDWGGGLLWMSLPASGDGGEAVVRAALKSGHATLFAAPEALRRSANIFQPQPAPLQGLTARVKAALDPGGKLNPGRMYKGI